ncbi:AsmA family protein [Rhodoblastus acidophilus]|uniref:AsmA family protein n=1 Tax=Candidatus Rhodoblastus alkanivorans TaxID=2954117 RepID=A0ABS9Z8Y9_9HYPH|nr:AsmA family protein [Candidatus Rhodoblastus alkanivorans]MCI4679317.1 AsmA family protein [Candidatus Rhodoblastus alkanivorans]MCI4684056.1 AsmA family protein [Candidatus Rhodoblastus alkanivorans]MDI4641376.1 AsmA family protein [Rhodoblastus acidophilus]
MRDLLTYIGIALILVLSAAFAAPYFIDFNAFRSGIAAELSQAVGARTRFEGPIALHFLPTPRFSAEDIDISGDFGHVHAKSAVFALALPGLLQGRLQFIRAALDDADVVLDADKARPPALAGALQFDDLALRRADVTILRGGAPAIEVKGLDLSARVPGPQGPFDGRGAFDWRGRRLAFSFSSDVLAKEVVPLKASLTWPGDTARLDLDGRVDFSRSPAFEGEVKASGKAAPGPWTAQASALLWLDGALARNFSARLGDGPLADQLSGSLRYETRSRKLVLALETPRLSQSWTAFFAAPLSQATSGGAPFDLRLGADAITWRGVPWSQARLIWRTDAPANLQATGPGESRIEISATPEAGGWRGKARLKAGDFGAFAAALRESAPGMGAVLAPAGLHAVDASAAFVATPDEWALSNGDFLLGRNRFSGDVRLRLAKAGTPPLLTARLSAPALDLDAAPDFAAEGFAGLDLDLSLQARTLTSSRAGALSGAGGRIDVHFLRQGEAMRLERLDMRNIGGADLTASAAWSRNFSDLRGEARLKAGDLGPLAQALARVWPSAATKALAARAKILSPADLSGKATDGGFSVKGTLGATRIAANFPPTTGGGRAVAIDLNAPEAGALLNQLGAPVVWTQKLGPARLSAHAQPNPARQGARSLAASADLAGLHGEFRGALADSTLEGEARLSGDAGKVLALYGQSGSAPLRFSARVAWRDGVLNAQNLDGDWAGAKVAGDLSADSTGLKGALHCGRFSGPALVALVLGPPEPAKAGALWSSLSFAPVLLDPPPAKLSVTTDDLEPFGGKAHFDFMLRRGALSVARAEAAVLDGAVRGGFDLRRDGRQISLSGEADAENLALRDRAFSARLDGRLKFAGGGGASAAALAASLAGDGAVRLRDLVVQQAAPGAPDEALKASEANDATFDAKAVAKSLDAAFARAALRRPQANFAARLADGQLALTPSDDGGKGIEAGFDLRDANLSLAFSASAQTPAGWSAPAPVGAVAWSGPWRAPSRRVDAAAFVDAVATRALEREQARIATQKKEDMERLRTLSLQPAPALTPAPPP